ncbi:hypothetical protein [[Mycoplasma] mobile]|uniref:Expressed protein n=1 Tax=Mycoplasma mobile (strain ATCC 43663 / 163K / NCTC 11711) TaxID=267748 RepID=Q6KH35_MYCM1|nr:hypothetical protein [[Mycoplasma] mobile]AAT28096.1 expressed protein [Mycoplasma mobile 163K]
MNLEEKYENKTKEKFQTKKIQINVHSEEEYLKKQKEFLEELELNWEKFEKENKFQFDYDNKYKEKMKDEKLGFYEFELSFKRSPLTIIHAPWGTGKTYFLDSLVKNFVDKKFENTKIERIIFIDLWKYSYSESIDLDISKSFYKNAPMSRRKFRQNATKGLGYVSKFINNALNIVEATPGIPKLNGLSQVLDFSKIGDYFLKEKVVKLFSVDETRKLVILDNIERLGENIWEIFKFIFELQSLENNIYLLPMNKQFLIHKKNESGGEYQIQKFIDISPFEFKQNYLGILTKFFQREGKHFEHLKNDLNKILEMEIEGQKLSIRELEQNLNLNKDLLFKQESRYKFLKAFNETIWNNWNWLKKIIKEDFEFILKNELDWANKVATVKNEYFLNDFFVFNDHNDFFANSFNRYCFANSKNNFYKKLEKDICSLDNLRSNNFNEGFKKLGEILNSYLELSNEQEISINDFLESKWNENFKYEEIIIKINHLTILKNNFQEKWQQKDEEISKRKFEIGEYFFDEILKYLNKLKILFEERNENISKEFANSKWEKDFWIKKIEDNKIKEKITDNELFSILESI